MATVSVTHIHNSHNVLTRLYNHHSSLYECPYFKSQFAVTFLVSTGIKFLLVDFFRADYPVDFNKSESFFSVTVYRFTLLSNFNAFIRVSASTESNSGKAVQKEYVIKVDETEILNITFSPLPNSYAFLNWIEIVSRQLIFTSGDDYDIKLVGQNNYYYINNNTALPNLYRQNVWGNFVRA